MGPAHAEPAMPRPQRPPQRSGQLHISGNTGGPKNAAGMHGISQGSQEVSCAAPQCCGLGCRTGAACGCRPSRRRCSAGQPWLPTRGGRSGTASHTRWLAGRSHWKRDVLCGAASAHPGCRPCPRCGCGCGCACGCWARVSGACASLPAAAAAAAAAGPAARRWHLLQRPGAAAGWI